MLELALTSQIIYQQANSMNLPVHIGTYSLYTLLDFELEKLLSSKCIKVIKVHLGRFYKNICKFADHVSKRVFNKPMRRKNRSATPKSCVKSTFNISRICAISS